MASLNAAECFRLTDRGAIAPGYIADILLLDDLEQLTIDRVYKQGKLVAERGAAVEEQFPPRAQDVVELGESLKDSVRIGELHAGHLAIRMASEKAHVIGIIPNQIVTKHLVEEVPVRDGLFRACVEKDFLKMAVIERHHQTGNVGLGIVHGLGLKRGAIASTVAHDSHNLIVAGTNDEDMLVAARTLQRMQGGLVVVADGEVLAALSLPIAGLIADQSAAEVCASLQQLEQALKILEAPTHFQPFLTLSFLALPVIPRLKLTDQGLFDVSRFSHIEVSANSQI
jgi:adenine deaminase